MGTSEEIADLVRAIEHADETQMELQPEVRDAIRSQATGILQGMGFKPGPCFDYAAAAKVLEDTNTRRGYQSMDPRTRYVQ